MDPSKTAEPWNDAMLPTSSRPTRRPRWRKKRPLAAAALAVIGIGAGGYAYVASRGEPAAPEPALASSASSAAPANVPPSVLDQHRLGGGRIEPAPDAATRAEMATAQVTRVVGVFKLCVDAAGGITEVKPLKSTGFAGYDRTIEAELRRWQYRPVEIEGRPSAICTAQTFIYRGEPSHGG